MNEKLEQAAQATKTAYTAWQAAIGTEDEQVAFHAFADAQRKWSISSYDTWLAWSDEVTAWRRSRNA